MSPANAKESKNFVKLEDKINATILESRRIFVSDAIDNVSAAEVIRKLWYLDLIDPKKPILLIINSPGGSVDSGFAIWDQVKMISCPVITLVTGLAASMGSILSLCATNGMRYATPEARIMIHQPLISGVVRGQATDLDIQAKEILKTRRKLVEIYVEYTGHDFATIERAIDRDTWFSAQEALDFGLLKGIVKSFDEIQL